MAKAALLSAMRNEGVVLLEWLAYHRVIGFDPIIVASNGCTDGSELLLDRLAEAGAVVHLPLGVIASGEAPQDVAVREGLGWLAAHNGPEWLAHFDSDEFLNIAHGAGQVADLLAVAGEGDVIALPWRMFGDNGHSLWPGETLAAFTACALTPDPQAVKFKSMFRHAQFNHASDHMPTAPRVAEPVVRSVSGALLQNDDVKALPRARYFPSEVAVEAGAVLNHYAVRSHDLFTLKAERGDGQGKAGSKYHLGSRWAKIANQNSDQDRSILRHLEAARREMARLRALPGVAEAEAECITYFERARAAQALPQLVRAQPITVP